MNLLLISPDELLKDLFVNLKDHRAEHFLRVVKVNIDDSIRVGITNGSVGFARVVALDNSGCLKIQIDKSSLKPPPDPLPCKLVVAMPRPKMMRRVLQNITAMGVKEIHLINSWKVEKSYWQTPWLESTALNEQLRLGLEQSVDTLMPRIEIHKLFKPFVEDRLAEIIGESQAYVAHPYSDTSCPVDIDYPSTVVIGPEGGFTDYEVGKLIEAGISPVNMGPRILRVETAIPALLSRLYPGRN